MVQIADLPLANAYQKETDRIVLMIPAIVVVLTTIMWYVKYRRDRKGVYELMAKLKEPPGNYIFGHSLMFLGTPTLIFERLTRCFFEYGPNFGLWFGPRPVAVIGKPEDLEILLHSQHCVAKSFFYNFTRMVVGEGIFSAPVHKWRRNRKLIQPTFNTRILNYFVRIFGNTSTICVNEILPNYAKKKDVNWYKVFASVNLDTISQTAMGINTDAQRKEIPFAAHLEVAMKTVYLRFFKFFYHTDFVFTKTSSYRRLRDSINFIDKFTDEVVQDKKAEFQKKIKGKEQVESTFDVEPMKRKVFLEMLIEMDHKGMKFTDEELRDEVKTFFVGGTDTSAVTSCFFLSMMGMHQDIQQQVYEEIIDVLGHERTPEPEDLPKLQLLERCIKETLRLFTPVPFISRVVEGQAVKLTEFTLPVGTILLFAMFYAHRCAEYWNEPLKFKPERFLPEELAKRHPYTFLPFSGGLRGCVGMRYSYMSLKTLVSMILRKYKVHCDYKSVEEVEVKNEIVLRPINGFKFTIEERM